MSLKFSIIIPTYNRGRILAKTVSTALSQSYRNFEVIIVDDGSTDDTRSVVESIKDDRVRYFPKVNEERGAARNFGVQKATGDYVCFLDSDDLLYDNHLAVASEFIEKKDSPEVFHLDYEYLRGDKRIPRESRLPLVLNQGLLEEKKLSSNGVVIRRDVALKHPFLAHRSAVVAEDLYVWITLAARYPFYHVPAVTSAVVLHDERSVASMSPLKFLKSMLLIIRALSSDAVVMSVFSRKIRRLFAHRMALSALLFAETRNKRWSCYLLEKARAYHGGIVLNRTYLATIRSIIFK